MAIQIDIPEQNPRFEQRTDLDGVPFLLRFEFSERACAWFFSIADEEGADILAGRKVVLG